MGVYAPQNLSSLDLEIRMFSRGLIVIACLAGWAVDQQPIARAQTTKSDPSQRYVFPSSGTRQLQYDYDQRGNRLPDFSTCGYRASSAMIPEVPTKVVVTSPSDDTDQTKRIQTAIDYVAQLPLQEDGFRGAVEIQPGRYPLAGQLVIRASGIVVRGDDAVGQIPRLVATGTGRRSLIRVAGKPSRWQPAEKAIRIVDAYVPCGAQQLRVDRADSLKAGDEIVISHASTPAWISSLGMNRFPTDDRGSWLDWKPGAYDVAWRRRIVQMAGDQLSLDAPLTFALDATVSQSSVQLIVMDGEIERVGLEQLELISEYDAANPLDEQHAWDGISLDHVRDAWVRGVRFQHFAGSAVVVHPGGRRVTVKDCQAGSPVSEMGGLRRRTFFTCGQQTLFRNCSSSEGIQDFAVGYLAAGPNAFVHCRADRSHGFSGPVESWASGVLYDNVEIDGGGLRLTNLETAGQGIGWAAANCVLWQCVAPLVECRRPPANSNWAIGCWGGFEGDGYWRSMNEFVDPDCLFDGQLSDRLGNAASRIDSPESAKVDRQANTNQAPIVVDSLAVSLPTQPDDMPQRPLKLVNGWLTINGQLLSGNRLTLPWWRGSLVPKRATELGPGITRFVPSRDGAGYTDDLERLTDDMVASHKVMVEHHWGLWYDRRRDDHQMVRRIDGQVWGPFYEQPWARSGQGLAWDGLSKYDLDRFNHWYFDRLQQFSQLATRKGLVLLEEMYFQHNILEAGAHWADFPWRSANCLQATGFTEPPVYVNKKRVFQADEFYDVSHSERRRLHEKYIRHCLDSLSSSPNVIFSLGEEYTGPLHFVQFWLDTIATWQRDTGRDPLICLSCTKDVQEAILEDPQYRSLIDIIELKYWWYTPSGVYDPPGGKNLAPRQQVREWKGDKGRSDELLARQVLEMRMRYPGKAVISALSHQDGWQLASAGLSIPALPPETPAERLRAIIDTTPGNAVPTGSPPQ